MKFRVRLSTLLCTCVVSLGFAATAAANGFQKAGAHGGSVSGSTTQKGNKISGAATATGPNGKSATANGTATVTPGKVNATGTVTGPNGGTAGGTASASNGTVNASGSATGKNGRSGSGSVSASPGTATVTNGSGSSKIVVKPTTPPSP